MDHAREFYVNGQWRAPLSPATWDVVDPATEQVITTIAAAGQGDVDRAVEAARAAFDEYSAWSVDDRVALLDRVISVYGSRMDEMAELITAEVGAPSSLSRQWQAPSGRNHLSVARQALADLAFEYRIGSTLITREPVGVCALITPWNWPIGQIASKVGPALAVGCTMVLKPSEIAPLSAVLFAEILDEAGVPPGVFNLLNGDGPTVGRALASHPDVDLVSFTGSTAAGVDVATAAAPTVKRVLQELGGKSANIILDDADMATAIERDVVYLCTNSGQSCAAPTRMLVPLHRMEEAAAVAARSAAAIVVGDPRDASTQIGPVAAQRQYDRIQRLIQEALEEGARLEAGGLGKPRGLETGYFVLPTVFSHVTNDMTIAQEEVFGPVLVLIGYEDDDDAVRIANDTRYGLSGYVSGTGERARSIARRLRTGNVHLNGADGSYDAPFGGYKQSGNGREWGTFGLEEYLETKAILGFGDE